MKVVSLKITNFRSIRSAELKFDGHCLIVGPNNVGKSTICEALDLVPWAGPDFQVPTRRGVRLSQRSVPDHTSRRR